ncbi:LysR family transcriptional regulator [Pokkaliibacter plantistimulans]|uniref:LysR family transcriptional regulator n=1 Tax=Pokkaliibacter plantistimulans TaxID=1635171 RepID=A0ABX5LTG9_9GAMM|nr:LysR family transcriptional regulator [Pokkaliibacter plantistimulans]PXF28895.1 LysR family transcriptional regulator [Pokkaliibacter plantistimulans]
MDIGIAKNLKINQLRLISAIAEHGQLGLAADELTLTQPAASRMLSEIENTLGAKLFERHAKGMVPTLIGRALAQRSHNLLVELRDLSRDVEELKGGEGGITTVGAVTGAAVGFVIPAIRQLKAISPKAEIHINVESSEVLVHDLAAGKNDFVLARLPRGVDPSDFEIHPARTEVVNLVVREDHPLAYVDQVTISDLSGYEWVMQSHRAPIREAVESAFLSAGAALPTNITNTTSLLAMIAILVSSSAIAPLASEVPDLLLGDKVGARLRVLPLKTRIVMSPYYLLLVKGRQLSPVANRLKALVTMELSKGNR